MKIKLAEVLGYCLGVRRAMDTAFTCLSSRDGAVFSHGELIHNPPALELLASKGLSLWNGEMEGSIIVRAHGLPPEELEALKKSPLTVHDATCPRVRRVQKLIAREAAAGKMVLIWGKAEHPEVIGLLGHAGPRGRVLAGPAEVAALPEAEEVLLVAQTTQDLSKWPEVVAAVQTRWPQAAIRNTICEATELRQRSLARLAGEVDALVIVGGKSSSNTARLAEIGRQAGRPTFLVESVADLNPADLAGAAIVGVGAGASTSTWQIAQVLQALRAMARSRQDFGSFWARLLRVLVLSGLYAAAGLASLALAAAGLLNSPPDLLSFTFFFFQVTALHLFRDYFQGRGRSQGQALRFNDPDRSAFYAKYSLPLNVFTLLNAALALGAAWLGGPRQLFIALLCWLAALFHLLAPRPKGRPSLGRALLGPFLLALGWAAVMVLAALPPQTSFWPGWPQALKAIFAGGAVFGHLFALGVMGDVLAAHGDRIFGRPTLPTVFGEKAAKRILQAFLLIWALALLAGWAAGLAPSLAGLLVVSGPLYNFLLLGPLFPNGGEERELTGGAHNPALFGFYFEAIMYGQLLLTGLLLFLWNL